MAQDFADRSGLTRRTLLRGMVATAALPVAACGDLASGGAGGLATGRAQVGGGAAGLLLPMTGGLAGLGANMARAASLAVAEGQGPKLFDTADTAEGAAAAATAALAGGARLLLGPLKADQTPAVLTVAGKVPVVTFSNDDALLAQGAFVMGITPAQSVSAAFSYARAQGLTRIALVARDTPLGVASVAAARAVASAGGITLTAALLRDPGRGGLAAALQGGKPQAVYLPDGGTTLAGFAGVLAGAGLQILGSVQWGVGDVTANPDLTGAWFAAPPPDLFQPFADRFEASFGEPPGVVAALGHDAALLAAGLGNARALNRRGLTRSGGFTGVLGAFRFLADGRCVRDLSILRVEAGRIVPLGEVAGT